MAAKTIDPILDQMPLDSNLARAILSEVASGGWLDQELPEDEKDLIELAGYYVDEANKWVEDGNPREEHINAIINLAKGVPISPPVLSQSAELNQIEETAPGEITQQEAEEFVAKSGLKISDIAKTYPRRSSGGYSESDLRESDYTEEQKKAAIEAFSSPIPESNWAATEGLPIPQNVSESDPYDMPTDLTEVGDKSLRRLYSAFNAYSGRARWMLAIATSNLSNATHLRDAAYREELNAESRGASIREEKVTKDILDARAKDNENYKDWEEKVLKHEKEVIHWRALSDIYGKNVEVLSREWSMRTEQYERER